MIFDHDSNTGIVTLKNPDSLKLRFSQSLVDYLGTPPILDKNFTISALKDRFVLYVHCNLIDRDRNLLNGKRSTLLVLLNEIAPNFTSMTYSSLNKSNFRFAKLGQQINSVTLWINDQDGTPINFRDQEYSFTLAFKNC